MSSRNFTPPKNQDIINQIRYLIGVLDPGTIKTKYKEELDLLIELQLCGGFANRHDYERLLDKVRREVING